jgi:hypothetical protein
VRHAFRLKHERELEIGNAIGGLFDNGHGKTKFEHVGYAKAKRPEAHARILKTWRLKVEYRANR